MLEMSQSESCDTSSVDTQTDNRRSDSSSKNVDLSAETSSAAIPALHNMTEDGPVQSLDCLNSGIVNTSRHKYTIMESGTSLLDDNSMVPGECVQGTSAILMEATTPSDKNTSKKIVKKVIMLQPDDDADKVTSDVIKEITAMLNNEAAKEIAQGKTPNTETVIEITGIKAPPVKHVQELPKYDLPFNTSPRMILPQEPKHHRRKSAHSSHYMYHSPLPVQQKNKAAVTLTNEDCYFQHQVHHCPSHKTASSRLLTRSSVLAKPTSTPNTSTRVRRPKPAILRSAHWSVSTGVNVQKKTAASATSTCSSLKDGINPALVLDSTKQLVTATATTNDENKYVDALTNIQWLDSLPSDGINPIKIKNPRQAGAQDRKTYVPKQRPPFSYMNLILMAICDDSNKRKTLKQIYQWIEEKFPYYKNCPSPSWKNSIRQNLSLCDIFINEKSADRSGRSYWKLNSSSPLVASYIHNSQATLLHALHNEQAVKSDGKEMLPVTQSPQTLSSANTTSAAVIVEKQQNKRKTCNRVPIPLLPKVPQLHVYSPQTVSNVIPVLLQPTVIMSPLSTPDDAKMSSQQPTQQQPSLVHVLDPAGQHLGSAAVSSVQVVDPSSASSDLPESAGCGDGVFRTRPGLESACKLLAEEEVRPEGLRTPPPMSVPDVLPKASMKHYCSPSETSGGKQTKHIKVAQEMDVYDHRTKRRILAGCSSSSSAVAGSLLVGQSSPSASMDSTDLSSLLSQVAFSDSGFVSDCSTVDSAASKTSRALDARAPERAENGSNDTFLPEARPNCDETSLSDLDLDIVSGMEPSLAFSVGELLWTPPKSHEMDGYLTSTPFRQDAMSTPIPTGNDSDDDLLSLSESMMNTTSDQSDHLTDSSLSLINVSNTKHDKLQWELSGDYLADEVISLEDGLSTFD